MTSPEGTPIASANCADGRALLDGEHAVEDRRDDAGVARARSLFAVLAAARLLALLALLAAVAGRAQRGGGLGHLHDGLDDLLRDDLGLRGHQLVALALLGLTGGLFLAALDLGLVLDLLGLALGLLALALLLGLGLAADLVLGACGGLGGLTLGLLGLEALGLLGGANGRLLGGALGLLGLAAMALFLHGLVAFGDLRAEVLADLVDVRLHQRGSVVLRRDLHGLDTLKELLGGHPELLGEFMYSHAGHLRVTILVDERASLSRVRARIPPAGGQYRPRSRASAART